jgi:hypothetical protein
MPGERFPIIRKISYRPGRRAAALSLLARVADLDVATCLALLEPVEALGLLAPTPGDPYSFCADQGVRVLPLSVLCSSFPVLSNPRNKRRAVALTEKQFAYSFGNALPSAESAQLYERFAIPGPGRPLFEASSANFTPRAPTAVDTRRADRSPCCWFAAGKDRTVPAAVVKAAYELYAASSADTEFIEYPERGHSAAFDRGWRTLSDVVHDRLVRRGL